MNHIQVTSMLLDVCYAAGKASLYDFDVNYLV